MKQKAFSTLLLTALLGSLIVVGSGCSKKSIVPPGSTSADGGLNNGTDITYPQAEYSEGSIEGTLDDTPTSFQDVDNMVVDANTDQNSREYLIRQGRSSDKLVPVYFDFDQISIRGDMADKLVANAAYIQQTNARIVIAGNCDERGTNEYNIALGEKRAQAVKQYLVYLGVNASQLRTVSYGEERPLFLGQDDFSWSQNRRADFIIE